MKECNKKLRSCAECKEAPCELTPPVLNPCPFCGAKVAEITNAKDLEECSNFEDEACPQFENDGDCGYSTVVCNFSEGGCGASSGWRATEIDAIEAWNNRFGI